VRSTVQANRGKARLLQGLPAQAPETPVLKSLTVNYFFSF
jgi:hypothetical protein